MNTPETINIEKYANALNSLIGIDIGYLGDSDENVNAIVEVINLALALEKRVKELTEENGRLRESECDQCACELLDQRDKAREEAERYKKYYFHHEYDQWEAGIKADTVRKMQEKFKERLDISVCGYSTEEVVGKVFDTIDRVAEEVLEETR